MNLYEVVVLSLLSGLLVPALKGGAWILVYALARVVVVREEAQVSALDRCVAETGWCSARKLGPGRLPADGLHFLFLRGPIFAVRSAERIERGGTRVSWTAYVLGGPAAEALAAKLTGDPRDVVVRYVYAPTAWRTSSITQLCAPPSGARPWQRKTVRALFERFAGQGRATALVCGRPGTGKSTLGELLAIDLKERLRLAPEVVKNLDLSMKGVLLEDAYDTPTSTSPVIIMLDEFDAMVDHAEDKGEKSEKGAREASSLADTPTSLLAVLDRLNRMPHLVVIATTNRSGAEMRAGKYARYTRAGRLDNHHEAKQS